MDDSPPQPTEQSPPPPPSSHTGSPTDFLKNVVGKRVIVRLLSGVDYRGVLLVEVDLEPVINPSLIVGVLSCLDGYMNIALEQTEEHVNGVVTNRYGDAFIRGNNGAPLFRPGIQIRLTLLQYCTFRRQSLCRSTHVMERSQPSFETSFAPEIGSNEPQPTSTQN